MASPGERAALLRATPRSQREARFAYRPRTVRIYLHIAKSLGLGLKDVLEREEAPMHVWRHVAYGKFLDDRYVRLALALYLRRPAKPRAPGLAATTGWAWPADVTLGAAERVFCSTPAHARLVKAGVLRAPGTVPTPEQVGHITFQWEAAWRAINEALGALDRKQFLEEVERCVATKPKRSPPRGRAKRPARPQALTADQRKLVRAFRELLLNGGSPIDEIANMVTAHRQPKMGLRTG